MTHTSVSGFGNITSKVIVGLTVHFLITVLQKPSKLFLLLFTELEFTTCDVGPTAEICFEFANINNWRGHYNKTITVSWNESWSRRTVHLCTKRGWWMELIVGLHGSLTSRPLSMIRWGQGLSLESIYTTISPDQTNSQRLHRDHRFFSAVMPSLALRFEASSEYW